MRNSLFILIALLAALGIAYFHLASEEAVKKDMDARKFRADDHFFLARSYPDVRFSVNAYEDALKEVKTERMLKRQAGSVEEEWENIGPTNIGGRITTIAVDPNDQDIIYAGASRGGVFKTTNGGDDWVPIFDEQLFLAIGDIEIDPNNSEVIYVGTGDKEISGLPAIGDGVYKSEDGGENWVNIGLENKRIISRLEVHPLNSDLIYASAMGLPFEPNEDRGLYKSEDGGENWEEVLQLGDITGVIDMVIHPDSTEVIYAAGWNRIRNNQLSLTYGLDAKVYKTMDGGESWNVLNQNWPTDSLSRIGLQMHPTDPNILYATVVDTAHQLGHFMKFDVTTNEWESLPKSLLDEEEVYRGFGWYFAKFKINPFDPSQIFIMGVDLWETNNEGATWQMNGPIWWTYEVHADKHDMVFLDENTMIMSTDGGLYKTTDGGNNWVDIDDLPNTQLYRVEVNPHIVGDYWVGAQDNGTLANDFGGNDGWARKYGGDGFQTRFHPTNNNIVFCEYQRGGIMYSSDGGNNFDDYVMGIDEEDRTNWDTPYIISQFPPYSLYTGTYRMYKKEEPNFITPSNQWNTISEDLTDGIIFAESLHTISTIAESQFNAGELYVGTSDANVYRSFDDGQTWDNITADLPERYVTDIKTSAVNPSVIFVSHSGYKDNDTFPHIHISYDNGDSWEDISGNLPSIAINDIELYSTTNDLIFVATDGGVFVTQNKGETWEIWGEGMPVFPVYDIEIEESTNTLIAATFARSVYTISIESLIPVNPYEDELSDLPLEDIKEEIEIVDPPIFNEEPSPLKLSVYPSPFKDFIQINYADFDPQLKTDIRLINMNGQVVLSNQLVSTNTQISTDHLSTGEYFIDISNAEGRYRETVLKIK